MQECLDQLAAPILLATITTSIVGAFMSCSIILPYIKIGVFLIVLSSVNWIYANLFFLVSINSAQFRIFVVFNFFFVFNFIFSSCRVCCG